MLPKWLWIFNSAQAVVAAVTSRCSVKSTGELPSGTTGVAAARPPDGLEPRPAGADGPLAAVVIEMQEPPHSVDQPSMTRLPTPQPSSKETAPQEEPFCLWSTRVTATGLPKAEVGLDHL